jgi:hypothetical protein
MKLLATPKTVTLEGMIHAINAFNESRQNPFGPNVPVRSHCPLLFCFEGKGFKIEFPFYPEDRDEKVKALLQEDQAFQTRHAVLFPMTRAMIQRQWHRVYAYEVERDEVTDVKLLVSKKQDPGLFEKHPKASAYPWVFDSNNAAEPAML